MSGTTIPRGNVKGVNVYGLTLSPAIVAANTSAEQTFTFTGLNTTDWVGINKPTSQAGLGIVGVRVSAANTLAINFMNATGSGITPTAGELYTLIHCSNFYNPLQTIA